MKENMNKEEVFHPEQSMAMISGMISNAKNRLADDGFMLIFWGWLVTITALSHYLSIKLDCEKGYWVWPILMPLGGIVSAIYGNRRGKSGNVKTYVDVYLGYLWGAFAIGMFIALGLMPFHGIKITYFFLMILYGIATFVSGGLLNFKPLIYGSIASFICAVVSVFLNEADQLLIISVALLFSYIIPGHMLRSKYRSQHV